MIEFVNRLQTGGHLVEISAGTGGILAAWKPYPGSSIASFRSENSAGRAI